VRQVQSGSIVNSLLVGVYKFWRSQAPYDKAPAAVDSRLLPSVMAASDERANVGMWATTFFCTILSCNLLGLVPFNEAPTSGLGFATGLGISTWATATALGFYKLGFSFPGHFIPGATCSWPVHVRTHTHTCARPAVLGCGRRARGSTKQLPQPQ